MNVEKLTYLKQNFTNWSEWKEEFSILENNDVVVVGWIYAKVKKYTDKGKPVFF